jgi:hypothetical protein
VNSPTPIVSLSGFVGSWLALSGGHAASESERMLHLALELFVEWYNETIA